jgi:hypothetical protein
MAEGEPSGRDRRSHGVDKRAVRRLVLCLSVLVLLAGGGCQGRESPEAAQAALTGAAAKLRAAGSATVRFEVVLRNTSGPDSVRWRGTTRFRYGDKPASATEFTDFSLRSTKVELRTITVGPVRYHRTPRLRTPPGKPWVRIDPGESVAYGPRVADPDLGLIDPLAYLGVLENIPRSTALLARTERTQTIDGRPARAFSVSCGLGSEDCPASDLGQARRVFSGDNAISMTFWLDDENRPRLLEGAADLDTGSSALGGRAFYRATVRIEIADLGGPVAIAEPAPDEVTTEITMASPT